MKTQIEYIVDAVDASGINTLITYVMDESYIYEECNEDVMIERLNLVASMLSAENGVEIVPIHYKISNGVYVIGMYHDDSAEIA